MVTPSSARIILYLYLVFKALEIVYCANGASVDRLSDRNGHRRKLVGEGKSVSGGGARTKSEERECKLTKKMLLHSDQLKLCPKKKDNIIEFFPDKTVFNGYKTYIAR